MAEELVFYVDGDNNVTVDMESYTWQMNFGSITFNAAVLRLMGDLFAGDDSEAQSLPTFVIYFGKFVEAVTFEVVFASDTKFHEFRKFAAQSQYFESTDSDPLQCYWGGSGDPFYTGENNVANLTKYQGMFSKINITRKVPAPNPKGTITFQIGKVIQL